MPQISIARTGSPAVAFPRPPRPLFLLEVHQSVHDVFVRLETRVGYVYNRREEDVEHEVREHAPLVKALFHSEPPRAHPVVEPHACSHVCVCVCVCCHPIYSGRQTCERTSRGYTGGRSHRISPPSFCGACLDFFSREGFSRPFPSATVKSNFVYPRNNHSPLVGHRVTPPRFELTSQRQKVSRLPTVPPGRPAVMPSWN